MVKITYKDISLTAKDNSAPTCSNKQSFSKLDQLKENNLTFKKFATCEEDYWLLDGTFENMLDDLSNENFGLWSKSISGDSGDFEDKPTLEITFSSYQTSVGLTLQFNKATNDYCNSLNIKWYQGENLLSSKDFTPDNAQYFCQNNVTNFNKLVIIFNSTNNPYRFLKLQGIEYGVIREFEDEELRSASLLEEVSLISEEISINTLNFSIDNKANIDFMFQKKQPLKVEYGNNLMGTFFIENSKRTSKTVYEIEAVDYIGLLDKVYFEGGTYTSTSASTLIDSIMGSIPYELDSVLGAKTLSGTLERCTKREALLQVLFAIGGVISTARSDKVKIFSLNSTLISSISEDEIYTGCSFENDDEVTEIRLTLSDGTIVSKKNPVITDDTPENILEFSGVFVNSSNASEILTRLYTYFVTNKQRKTNIKFKFSSEKPGDTIGYKTEYLGGKVGQITSMKYTLNSRKLVVEAEIKELEASV